MNLQSGLVLSEEEWAKEWNDVLQMSAPTPRTSQVSESGADGVTKSNSTEQIYESLETIHVFALAHILKRPVVVVSDTVLRNANGEELSPIPFGGIYLPLECPPEQCHRSPLVLCYDSSHFSALVAMRSPSSPYLTAVPIMDKNRNILPVHFAVDPSPDFSWWKDDEDKKIAEKIDAKMTEDYRLDLIGRYMDVVKMDLRRGSIKKTLPVANSQDP
uniref:ubiquitinyl hydrolase 1 n=1 Tax=Panagrolaimus davidi TaxID=227884 RepID=A0A914QR04_9BILA